jgi:hypothetical protein
VEADRIIAADVIHYQAPFGFYPVVEVHGAAEARGAEAAVVALEDSGVVVLAVVVQAVAGKHINPVQFPGAILGLPRRQILCAPGAP